MGAINLKLDESKFCYIDGVRCRHWASQDRTVEGISWGKNAKREDFKKLPDHPDAFYTRTTTMGIDKKQRDCFVIKDDDEIHIYEIV